MFNKKEVYVATTLFTSAALILSSCARETSPVNINVANAGNLEVYSGTAVKNINVIKNACKEIQGYLPGTEQEIQFTNSSGILEAYAFCNDGNKTWVVGNQKAGENPIIILQELVYEKGVNDGKQIEELGYVTDSGESKPIYMKVDGVPYIFSADGTGVEVKNGKSSMDRFIEMATYSNASALGLPTQRPITAEDFTATPQFTLTPEATATLEPTATPDRYASYTVENLTRIPKSEAEIATSCVEIASPIDNWDQYSKDMDKVLALFPEIMKDYTGPYLSTRNRNMTVNSQELMFFNGADLVPVMCVKFKYKDKWGVQLTMAAKDMDGFVPFNVIINPDKTLEGEVKITSIDKILNMLPGKVEGNMSVAEALWCPWSNDKALYWNSPFIMDYFANKNNTGFAEILVYSWFTENKFDWINASKRAVILSNWQLPHTNDGELIKP